MNDHLADVHWVLVARQKRGGRKLQATIRKMNISMRIPLQTTIITNSTK